MSLFPISMFAWVIHHLKHSIGKSAQHSCFLTAMPYFTFTSYHMFTLGAAQYNQSFTTGHWDLPSTEQLECYRLKPGTFYLQSRYYLWGSVCILPNLLSSKSDTDVCVLCLHLFMFCFSIDFFLFSPLPLPLIASLSCFSPTWSYFLFSSVYFPPIFFLLCQSR